MIAQRGGEEGFGITKDPLGVSVHAREAVDQRGES